MFNEIRKSIDFIIDLGINHNIFGAYSMIRITFLKKNSSCNEKNLEIH